MWVARDKDGSLRLYEHKPKRFEDIWVCADHNTLGNISNVQMSEVTWENSPKELIIKTKEK